MSKSTAKLVTQHSALQAIKIVLHFISSSFSFLSSPPPAPPPEDGSAVTHSPYTAVNRVAEQLWPGEGVKQEVEEHNAQQEAHYEDPPPLGLSAGNLQTNEKMNLLA